MEQHQSDLAINKVRYIISLVLAEIVIFSLEYLFEFLARENLNAFQTFTLTCYFEIPNFCIFVITILTGLLMNEKNINFLKKRKFLIVIVSIIVIALFITLTINYESNLKNDEYFCWPISAGCLFLTIVDYPWVTKKVWKKQRRGEEDKIE